MPRHANTDRRCAKLPGPVNAPSAVLTPAGTLLVQLQQRRTIMARETRAVARGLFPMLKPEHRGDGVVGSLGGDSEGYRCRLSIRLSIEAKRAGTIALTRRALIFLEGESHACCTRAASP